MQRILRLPEVMARTGFSSMTLWRREHKNPPTFPRRVRLGPNSVGWVAEEIDAWIEARIVERDARHQEQRATPAAPSSDPADTQRLRRVGPPGEKIS